MHPQTGMVETITAPSALKNIEKSTKIRAKNKGSILNIGVEEKKVEHKSPKSCRIESSNLIFTGGVYALQGLYNKNTGYGTHEG